jgi:hypothetical protein
VLPKNWETIVWSRDIPAPRSCVRECMCALMHTYIMLMACMLHTSHAPKENLYVSKSASRVDRKSRHWLCTCGEVILDQTFQDSKLLAEDGALNHLFRSHPIWSAAHLGNHGYVENPWPSFPRLKAAGSRWSTESSLPIPSDLAGGWPREPWLRWKEAGWQDFLMFNLMKRFYTGRVKGLLYVWQRWVIL